MILTFNNIAVLCCAIHKMVESGNMQALQNKNFPSSKFLAFSMQCGSEITDWDFKRSNSGWFGNGPEFDWDLESVRPTIWNLDKWQPFCHKPFQIWTKMDFAWSSFRMARTITIAIARPFENRTIWNLIVKKSGSQIPTAFGSFYLKNAPTCNVFK